MIIKLNTSKHREVIDISEKLEVPDGDGLLNIFVRHTTACVSIVDLDSGTDADYLKALTQLTPDTNWNHPHEPRHFPDHLWPAIVGSTVSIPYQQGTLLLGTWQRVVLIELDGPREREIALTLISSR